MSTDLRNPNDTIDNLAIARLLKLMVHTLLPNLSQICLSFRAFMQVRRIQLASSARLSKSTSAGVSSLLLSAACA